MPENHEHVHEHSVLTDEQHQRVAALNTAAACLGSRGPLGNQVQRGLPGDLIRVAQWIIDGQLLQAISGNGHDIERDKRTGFLVAYVESGKVPPLQPGDDIPNYYGDDEQGTGPHDEREDAASLGWADDPEPSKEATTAPGGYLSGTSPADRIVSPTDALRQSGRPDWSDETTRIQPVIKPDELNDASHDDDEADTNPRGERFGFKK
jgi:hypothetical protein